MPMGPQTCRIPFIQSRFDQMFRVCVNGFPFIGRRRALSSAPRACIPGHPSNLQNTFCSVTIRSDVACVNGFPFIGGPCATAATYVQQAGYGCRARPLHCPESPACPPREGAGPHRRVTLCVLVVRVLPRLRQQPVIPVDVVGVEAQSALLDVLLDGGAGLVLQTRGGRRGAWSRRAGWSEPIRRPLAGSASMKAAPSGVAVPSGEQLHNVCRACSQRGACAVCQRTGWALLPAAMAHGGDLHLG